MEHTKIKDYKHFLVKWLELGKREMEQRTDFILHYQVCMCIWSQKQPGDMKEHFIIGLTGLSFLLI